MEPPSDVAAYCKNCKTMTEHSPIVAPAKKPRRVQCKACQEIHAFRSSPPPRKKTPPRKTTAEDGSYDGLMKGRDLSAATKYGMMHRYSDRDLIDHEVFGIGLVLRVCCDRKIEVLFPAGARLLAHER